MPERLGTAARSGMPGVARARARLQPGSAGRFLRETYMIGWRAHVRQ
jgi:hypothetical protein